MCNPSGTAFQKAIFGKLSDARLANQAEATNKVSSDVSGGLTAAQGSRVRALQQLSTNQLRVRSSQLNVN